MVIEVMEQDRKLEAEVWAGSSETARETRSGLPGLGGRPSLHPAWSGSPHAQVFGLMSSPAQAPTGTSDMVSQKKGQAS